MVPPREIPENVRRALDAANRDAAEERRIREEKKASQREERKGKAEVRAQRANARAKEAVAKAVARAERIQARAHALARAAETSTPLGRTGTCSVCEWSGVLTMSGTVRKHAPQNPADIDCKGSGKAPRREKRRVL